VSDLVPEKNSAAKARLLKWDHEQVPQPHFKMLFFEKSNPTIALATHL